MDSAGRMLKDIFELHANPPYLCEVMFDSHGLVYRQLDDKKGGFFETKLNVQDIIGCHCMKARDDTNSAQSTDEAYFCIYTYPLRKKSIFSSKTFRRCRQTVIFKIRKHETFDENLAEAKKWKSCVLLTINGYNFNLHKTDLKLSALPRTRKLLVLVNPNSGPKKAKQIFNQRVKPILSEGNVNYSVVVTERANHARELVKMSDMSEWDGIVIVSGDGLIYEVVNGIMERPDWRDVLRIPLGVVPGGSGNGLARAISHSIREPYDSSNQMYNSMAATLNLIRGRVTHMDLIKVETRHQTIYAFLSIGWGLFADIDIESEKMRSIGEARFTVGAIRRIAGLRFYKGRLSYLPVEGYVPPSSSNPSLHKKAALCRSETLHGCDNSEKVSTNVRAITKSHSLSGYNTSAHKHTESMSPDVDSFSDRTDDGGKELVAADCSGLSSSSGEGSSAKNVENDCDGLISKTDPESELVRPNDAFANNKDDKIPTSARDELSATSLEPDASQDVNTAIIDDKKTSVYLPPLDQPVPDNWIVEVDQYVMIYTTNVSHVGTDICLAPDARFDDGIMWMVIVRGEVSRTQILEMCFRLEYGRHVDLEYCSVIPVHAFRLEPDINVSDGKSGFLTVDGEVVEYGPIQAGVLPSVARVMTQ